MIVGKLGDNRPSVRPGPIALRRIFPLKEFDILSVKTFGNETLIFLVYSFAVPIVLPNPIVWVGVEGF